MQVTLTRLNSASQESVEVEVTAEERIVIGRHLGSPLLLQGEALSRQHFAIFLAEDQLMVENLSNNGTRINGTTLSEQEPMPLQTGDVIEVPGHQIRVDFVSALQESEATKPNVPVWQTYSKLAMNFFDPLEATLLVCAIACVGLFAYYMAT